jgi:hypothetical protein
VGPITTHISRAAAALALSVAIGGLAAPATATHASVASVASSAPTQSASPLEAAVAEAQATGEEVVVDTETTERRQVVAEPDGGLRLTTSLEPVRVEGPSGWQPVDTTLARQPDGTIKPARTTVDLTFSGGGNSDPMVRIESRDSQALAFSWPTTLPEPTLSGDTATYPDVLPGVDLRLTALANSYSEVLVVKNREAAQNPALRNLRLPTDADGLTLRTDNQGILTALDSAGQPVFTGPTPIMWDSTTQPGGPTPSASDSGTGRVSTIPLTIEADNQGDAVTPTVDGDLVLEPSTDALTGADVVYPVYLDPSVVSQPLDDDWGTHSMTVHVNGFNYYDDPVEPLRVGYCGWAGCYDNNGVPQGRGRSYAWFNVAPITNAPNPRPTPVIVDKASLTIGQKHSAANCDTATPTELWTAGDWDPDATWPGPRGATKLGTKWSNASDDCTPGNLVYDGAGVLNYVKSFANGSDNKIGFNFSAADEDDKYQWKKLGNNPMLTVWYYFKPTTPTNVGIVDADTTQCDGKPTYLYDRTPMLKATSTDPNGFNEINFDFEIAKNTTDGPVRTRHNTSPVAAATGTDNTATATWETNSSTSNNTGPLQDGTYLVRAKATADTTAVVAESGWSGYSWYHVDTNPPAVPKVSSFDMPPNAWGPTNGTFQVTGSSDTAGFAYAFNSTETVQLGRTTCQYNHTTNRWVKANADGTATIPLPSSLTKGPHTLYVKAFDDAHNVSAPSTAYTFVRAGNFGTGDPVRLEGEDFGHGAGLTVTADGGSHGTFSSSVPTSGGQVRVLTSDGTKEPATFTFTFPRNVTSYSAIGLRVLKSAGSGQIEANIDGHPLLINGTDRYSLTSTTTTAAHLKLGGARLEGSTTPTNHRLNIKLYGGNGKLAYIDFIHVIPISQVTYDSFALAKNNDAIAPLHTAADIGPSAEDAGIISEDLASVGYTPGTSVSHDGTTFYLQPHAGKDNVLAMGQTIVLDEDPSTAQKEWRTATSVDLLATTTCKPMTTAPHYASVTVNHDGLAPDDNQPDTALIPVPNWLTGLPEPIPQTGAAIVTKAVTIPDYSVDGERSSATGTPSLYHIRIPTKPGFESYPIKSITLPSVGTDEFDDCKTTSLHIFSIATTP